MRKFLPLIAGIVLIVSGSGLMLTAQVGGDQQPDLCGNGVVDAGEECDDGTHSWWTRWLFDDENCEACAFLNNDSAQEPDQQICGDGILTSPESCDDGNINEGDGCSPNCLNEFCGNGLVESATEQCDDGNTESGDGCSAGCETEEPSSVCGDGTTEGTSEECDDGNTEDGDGCSAECAVESDPVLGGSFGGDDGGDSGGDTGGTDPVCGNGITENGEECDDGNTESGDGCDGFCVIEEETCGNGTLDDSEECDPSAENTPGYEDDVAAVWNSKCGFGEPTACDPKSCMLGECTKCGNGTIDKAAGEKCDSGWPGYASPAFAESECSFFKMETCTIKCVDSCKKVQVDGSIGTEPQSPSSAR